MSFSNDRLRALQGSERSTGSAGFTARVKFASSTILILLILLILSSCTAVGGPPLQVKTVSLQRGTVGTAYQAIMHAAGGVAPYNWTITTGSLPLGLTLDPSGVISGTPSQAVNSTVTVQVTDNGGQSVARNFVITVVRGGWGAPPPPAALQVLSPSVPPAKVGAPYQASLSATGGAQPYSWTVDSGSLPAGLALDATSGAINGMPNQPGDTSFTVRVTDSTSQSAVQPLAISVTAPLQITTGGLAGGKVGTSYQASVAVTGGTQPYSWSIVSGALPSSLALNPASGTISGTPSTAGHSSFTMKVNDSAGQSAQQPLAISVAAAPPSPLQITTSSLAGGQVGTSYQASVSVTGGTQPYSWSIVSGTLPSSLVLNPASGTISGTPSTAGNSSFTVKVNDSGNQSAQQPLAISVAAAPAAPLQITTSSLAGGQVGTSYQASVSVTGGTQPYTWSIASGALPSSLALNPASGTISGTPSTAGHYSFTMKVNDSAGQSAQQPFAISVAAAPAAPLQITTSSLAGGQVGTSYQASVSVTGGTQPYSWSIVSGLLPTGLALNAASGTISGMPGTAGNSSFTVKVNDAASKSAQQPLAISVAAAPAAPLQITTSSLAGGQVGTSYQASVSVTGGTQPYSWSIASGLLPTGLALNAASGTISGMPGTAGNSSFTVKVNDSGSKSAQQPLAISVAAAAAPLLSVTTTSLPSGMTGQAYSATLQATGGKPAYAWSLAAGQLPPGMQLTASNGQITGTATTAGQYNSTVQVTDSSSPTAQTALQALTLSVAASQPAGSTPNLPTPPQKQVDVTMPDTTGYTVTAVTDTGNPVVNATNLQLAINTATCNPHGTILQLQHGASFSGAFNLPNKSCAAGQWILIESDASPSVLPAAGVRVKPSDVANMPTIVASLRMPAFTVAIGATNYRLMTMEIKVLESVGSVPGAIVAIGNGNYQGPQNTVALEPSNIIIDRSYIHGSDSAQLNTQRGVEMDCQYCAVINSYISEIHWVGIEAQAIGGWNSTGPWLVDNNYLSAAGENILVGGADTTIPNAVPSDLTFTRNYFFKPLSWNWRAAGKPFGCSDCWAVKNLLEFKEGVRVLVEGNIFQNNWVDAQVGEAIVIKSENRGNTVWVTTQDFTFRYNELSNIAGGSFQVSCDNNSVITGPCSSRLYMHDNLATGIGGASGRYIGLFGDTSTTATYDGTDDMYFTHNTIITLPPNSDGPYEWLSMESIVNPGYAPYVRFAFTNNIVSTYDKPVASNCQVRPNAVACSTSNSFLDNVYYGTTDCTAWWGQNGKCLGDMSQVQFVNPSANDYRLCSAANSPDPSCPGPSPAHNAATDGVDSGADIVTLNQKTQGTVSGSWN
jgi:hypothetical protein